LYKELECYILLKLFTTCNFLVDMWKFIKKVLLFKCLIIETGSMLNKEKRKQFD